VAPSKHTVADCPELENSAVEKDGAGRGLLPPITLNSRAAGDSYLFSKLVLEALSDILRYKT
jgi:hypothetical protein